MAEKLRDTGGNDALSKHWNALSESDVNDILAGTYGLKGELARLSSERDETFLVTCRQAGKFVLKIANPSEDTITLSFQDRVLEHLKHESPSVPVPRLIPGLDGQLSSLVEQNGQPRIVRLLTFLEGEQQFRTPPSTAQSRNTGIALAQLSKGLSTFQGTLPAHKLLWDITHTLDLKRFVASVAADRQLLVSRALEEFQSAQPGIQALRRRQTIHNDFNPHNILVDKRSPTRIVGIIDFGDMVSAPLVNDLAVALSYHVAEGQDFEHARAFLAGFSTQIPLDNSELELLPVLIKARLAMTLIITEWRAASRPENRNYILRNHSAALQGLQRLGRLPEQELHHLLRNSCEA
ncbi:phosphotransferase [Mesorhizobium sp. DCY119]|jgi:Ser/Thr protein kinase RdoA (MazF antagonist)|uniref:phosphotransferase n=1 Tax=Mesorhizobium sp. DCY119 TaxID=2108445 RepID=UPI000E6C2211|nr:phosphotransferase [Mesorhizobium sp. DCY119]RJG44385.1 phosphotransferase [Mesorhizobium sp. DCY119]